MHFWTSKVRLWGSWLGCAFTLFIVVAHAQVPATPGATDAPYEGTGPIPQAGVGGVGSVGSLPAGGAASALAALLTGTRTAAAAGPPVGLASVREPLAAVNPQPSALAPVVQIVGTLGAERVKRDAETRAAVAPAAAAFLGQMSSARVAAAGPGTAVSVVTGTERTEVPKADAASARGVATAAAEPAPAVTTVSPAAQNVIGSLPDLSQTAAALAMAPGAPPSTVVRRQPSIDANETLDASFQDLVTGMTGGYEPVPMLVRGPSRQLGRKRVPANAIFTVTGTGARLNGDRLLIFGASPAVSFVTTAPVYRAGVMNTSFFADNLTSPTGWLGNPDAVLYGTRLGKSVAAVLNIKGMRWQAGLLLAEVNMLPRDFGPLYSNGVVAEVQSSALAGTDGNGLTILSFLPGGVKWENVALVVETVLQEFRAAPGGKVRPVVKGDAGIQMSCTSDSLWKPAFCANP